MRNSAEPYGLPGEPERGIAGILSFWQGLKRHGAEIPFWDDVKISDVSELSGALALVEVTERGRYRFGVGVVGGDINIHYGADLAGKFLDELDIRDPLRCTPGKPQSPHTTRPARAIWRRP